MDTEDLNSILSSVRQFVRTEVVPLEVCIDDRDRIPDSIVEQCKEMGLYGFAIPEQYGGLGMSASEEVRLAIELGWTTPALRSLFGTNNGIAGQVLLTGGTTQQKQAWLPRLATGEITASFGLTEADAGSDPSALTTTAKRTIGGWVLNGAKRYITNAPVADVVMVFARTNVATTGNRGISAFLVPKGTPGLTIGPKDRKMGQNGTSTADVLLDDVHVADDALVGGDGGIDQGFRIAAKCLAHGRLHIAALCVGIAARLLHESCEFAKTREQGGAPIARFQLIQGLIADSVTDHRAGRGLVVETAQLFDAGSDTIAGPAAAKYFCSEMVGRVADRAVQIHGGAGYMRGVPVERIYRDVRLLRIYEGTSQVQQVIIAREALGDGTHER